MGLAWLVDLVNSEQVVTIRAQNLGCVLPWKAGSLEIFFFRIKKKKKNFRPTLLKELIYEKLPKILSIFASPPGKAAALNMCMKPKLKAGQSQ